MQGPPKEKRENDLPDEGAASADQREREYYYDDAHGYEVYEPEDDEESDDEPIPRLTTDS